MSSALTKYLHAAGHDVRLFTPLYSSIKRDRFPMHPVDGMQNMDIAVGPHRYVMSVLTTRMPGSSASIYLIDCPALYSRATLYTEDADEHLRFLAFTRAAFACCQRMQWSPEILHCNDWHTAFAPLMLRTGYREEPLLAPARTLLTIHNIGYQGIFPATAVADLDLGAAAPALLDAADLAAGRINALRHGIRYAGAVSTVSPTHAREIATEPYGMGLAAEVRARGEAVSGILNGVDYAQWDPRHDPFLPEHYDPEHLAGKARLKAALQRRLGLASEPAVPLLGMVTRLAAQKGIELLYEALPRVLGARALACVVLGSGEAQYERFLRGLAGEFPGRVHFTSGYDEALAHWIEAGSDLFLMPSRYEPCGLNQMYSLRYGTVPVVRRTGGLADSVEHFDAASGRGTGIVFNDFDAPALEWALNTALDLYATPHAWAQLRRNGMARDFSWTRQAGAYVALYRQLLAAAGAH